METHLGTEQSCEHSLISKEDSSPNKVTGTHSEVKKTDLWAKLRALTQR